MTLIIRIEGAARALATELLKNTKYKNYLKDLLNNLSTKLNKRNCTHTIIK